MARLQSIGANPAPPAPPRSHWFVVGTVCVGALMAMLDSSIVNVALPTFQRAFDTTVAHVEWIAIVYLLTLTMLLTVFGRAADLFGRSRMYNLGFVVFVLGSVACALSPSLGVLIGARVLQAGGAAMLQTNSVALIAATAPQGKLGTALGVQGAAQAVGLAIGPPVGGLLLLAFGWQAIFWVNVPFGVVGTVLALIFLPKDRHVSGKAAFDPLGAVLIASSVFAGMLALSEGVSWGWVSPQMLGLVAACVMFGTSFVRWELGQAQPLVDPRLFLHGEFALGISVSALSYVVLQGGLFLTPFYLTRAGGLSARDVGLFLTAVPITLGLTAPFAGRFSDRVGPRSLTVIGMIVAAAGLGGLGLGIGGFSAPAIATFLGLLGLGLGLFTSPNNASVMTAGTLDRLSIVGGILNMSRSLGMSTGVALAGTIYALRLAPLQASVAPAASQTTALRTDFLVLAGVGLLAALISSLRAEGARHRAPRRPKRLKGAFLR